MIFRLKNRKIIIYILMLTALPVLYNFLCVDVSNNLADYSTRRTKYQYSARSLPELSSLSIYEDVNYGYKKTSHLIVSEAIFLDVTYNHKIFEIEKEKLLSSKTFLKDDDLHTIATGISEVEFDVNSYHFQVLDDMDYPASFGLIAISDERKSIAYLYYNDLELDEVNSMPKFIKNNFKYHW